MGAPNRGPVAHNSFLKSQTSGNIPRAELLVRGGPISWMMAAFGEAVFVILQNFQKWSFGEHEMRNFLKYLYIIYVFIYIYIL